jgi:large subunit ribosomal protein L21
LASWKALLAPGPPEAHPEGLPPPPLKFEVSMYAVIRTGGKQYRVAEGDVLRVELLEKDPKQAVVFDQVLLVSQGDTLSVGQPTVKGAQVEAEVIRQGRAKKVIIFKKKKTTTYQRTQGHRQWFTEVRITAIKA